MNTTFRFSEVSKTNGELLTLADKLLEGKIITTEELDRPLAKEVDYSQPPGWKIAMNEHLWENKVMAVENVIVEKQEIANDAARQYNDKYHPLKRAKQKGYTDVVETANGGVSFENSEALYVTADSRPGIVKIEATGSRSKDFDNANNVLGIGETPEGYVWHHVDNYDIKSNTITLQLVKEEAHNATKPHSGGCAQYDAVNGPSYNPSRKDV